VETIDVSMQSLIEAAPRYFQVFQNYPNPFNPTTTIKFSVEKSEHATVSVYNIIGQEVAKLFDGIAIAGRYYTLEFNGSGLGSGLYFYRVLTESNSEVKKMLFLQ
jgi:hypothetical protein